MRCDFLHLLDGTPKVKSLCGLGAALFDILVEISIGEFIIIFEFAVVFAPLLDGVISEVDKAILKILEVEVLAGCADVSLLVPIALDYAID